MNSYFQWITFIFLVLHAEFSQAPVFSSNHDYQMGIGSASVPQNEPQMDPTTGQSFLTFDKSTVYIGDNVTAKCAFPDGYVPLDVRIDAFNGTRNEGSLHCTRQTRNTTGDGVFTKACFSGCPVYPAGKGMVSITLKASLMLELDYMCTVRAYRRTMRYVLLSNKIHLTVNVLPDAPRMSPDIMVFNEYDNVHLECNSRHGKPIATIYLDVVQQSGTIYKWMRGKESASLTLPSVTKDLHYSTVTCTVENHNNSNLFSRETIIVNYMPIFLCCSSESASFINHKYACMDADVIDMFPNATAVATLQRRADCWTYIALRNITFPPQLRNIHQNDSDTDINSAHFYWGSLVIVLLIVIVILVVLLFRARRHGEYSWHDSVPETGREERHWTRQPEAWQATEGAVHHVVPEPRSTKPTGDRRRPWSTAPHQSDLI